MKIKTTNQPFLLLLGDIVVLLLSLWLTLFVRYAKFPSADVYFDHLAPFSIIFGIWIVVYFIYDLYGNQTTILQSKLSGLMLNAHVVNSITALAFFYFIPYFSITPKTNLFIFLIVSFVILELWRRQLVFIIMRRVEETILFTAAGKEAEELIGEFKSNALYQVRIISEPNFDQKSLEKENNPIVVINTHDAASSSFVEFYHMLFSGVRFVTLDNLYESIFGRVPISSISERWFLESISNESRLLFEFLKRVMDVLISLSLGLVSLIFYPFIIVAIKLDDGGDIFIRPERIGENNQPIKLLKFRTMTIGNDGGHWGTIENKVTKVGTFLRQSRLDELPQLWNVLKGDLSLVGPRPEFAPAVKKYSEEIKYYNIRHLVKPGLSGWAQIYGEQPHHGIGIEETKNKLSYDLYYIKHRSILLDIKIALKTVRILLSRSGI